MLDFTPERIVHDLFVVAILGILFSLSSLVAYRPRRDIAGWNLLRPSLLHWLCVVGCAFFVSILLFLGVNFGFRSRDFLPFAAMVGCFTAGGTFIGLHVARLKRLALRWQNNTLAFNDEGGQEVVRFMDEISEVLFVRGGEVRLLFNDGLWLKVDTMASGAEALLGAIAARRWGGASQ